MRWLAGFAAALISVVSTGTPTIASEQVWGCAGAGYQAPTREYRHAVLGDDIEYKELVMLVPDGDDIVTVVHRLGHGQVFEDIAPRCWDFTGDGVPEAVTIISDAQDGARLAVFSLGKPLAETPPIGRGFRWLAPAGIADLNGDGTVDIAYVDRPHIGGALKIWTLRGEKFDQIGEKGGFSNHRIGEAFITGGVRDCGDGPALVLPNFNWSAVMQVTMTDGLLKAEEVARPATRSAVIRALECN